MEQKRNQILDVYKGILIILVVFRHVLQYSTTDEGGILTNIIWAVQMPGFMILAGYFAAKMDFNIKAVPERIKKVCIRYFVPFISWFVLVDILLLGKYDRNIINGIKYIIFHIDSGLWFLWILFLLSLMAIFWDLLSNKGTNTVSKLFLGLLGILLTCGLMIIIIFLFNKNFIGINFAIYYLPFYAAGWIIKRTKEWENKISDKFIKVFFFISFILFSAIVFNYDLYRGNGILVYIMRYFAGFSGITIIAAILQKNGNILNKTKLSFIGKKTLEIYVVHMYVNNLMINERKYGFFTINGFENFFISLILTVIFTILGVIVVDSIPIVRLILFGKKSVAKNN